MEDKGDEETGSPKGLAPRHGEMGKWGNWEMGRQKILKSSAFCLPIPAFVKLFALVFVAPTRECWNLRNGYFDDLQSKSFQDQIE